MAIDCVFLARKNACALLNRDTIKQLNVFTRRQIYECHEKTNSSGNVCSVYLTVHLEKEKVPLANCRIVDYVLILSTA